MALAIDPDRVVAAGASAGAHIALAAAVFEDRYDDPGDDASISARPDALVLFAPVVDTTASGYRKGVPLFAGRERELSPVHHMKKGLPPTLILQGTADRWIPVASVERFVAQCHSLGSECELALFSGRNHHFYNHKHYFELRPHVEGPYASADFGFISYLLEHFLRNHEFS